MNCIYVFLLDKTSWSGDVHALIYSSGLLKEWYAEPHVHGDVHALIYSSGILREWYAVFNFMAFCITDFIAFLDFRVNVDHIYPVCLSNSKIQSEYLNNENSKKKHVYNGYASLNFVLCVLELFTYNVVYLFITFKHYM